MRMLLPNVQDEPRPWLARAVLLGARVVTAMVVGSGALLGHSREVIEVQTALHRSQATAYKMLPFPCTKRGRSRRWLCTIECPHGFAKTAPRIIGINENVDDSLSNIVSVNLVASEGGH